MNASDRIIRIYNYAEMLSCGIAGDLEPKQRLQDLVNKSLWRKCCWSGDGEYICGASSRQHSLYIWETVSGSLIKILHGTKGETLSDVCWHPVRPIIASISSGVVSIWSHSQVENWSAFAPDFRELEENVEYHERESEFDVKDEDRSLDGLNYSGSPNKRQRSDSHPSTQENDQIDIDVVTEQRIEALVSSDDDDINDQLIYLPSAPDIEDPDTESNIPMSQLPRTRSVNPSSTADMEPDETFEIPLQIPPVYDPHPYYGTARQSRSTLLTQESTNSKRDVTKRRKAHPSSDQGAQQSVLLAKSIDAAVATVINTPQGFIRQRILGGQGPASTFSSSRTQEGSRGRRSRYCTDDSHEPAIRHPSRHTY